MYGDDKMSFKDYLKESLKGIFAIALYFGLQLIQLLPFDLLNININDLSMFLKISYLIIYEFMIVAIIVLIFRKDLKRELKDLKENHRNYYGENFKYWLIGLAIMMISNLIINVILDKGISGNEEVIRDMFKVSPIYIYLSGVIFAPFIEELIFRKSFKKIFYNKYLFLITSSLAFGFAHLIGNISSSSDLLYLIPYSSLGFAFAFMYEKTKNIFTPAGFHFLHNGILISLQFLMTFF